MGKNRIFQLTNWTFEQTPNLQTLLLDSNRIAHIEKHTFSRLKQLRTLILRNNEISSLPRGLFSLNRRLVTLDLSQNMLHYLPPDAIRDLSSLVVLNVSANRFSSAQLHDNFRYMRHLQQFDLSHNSIRHINDGDFRPLQWWTAAAGKKHHINLSSCDVTFIQSGAFRSLTSITGLSLADNHLLPLQSLTTALNDLPASDLERLTLSNVSLYHLNDLLRDAKFRKLRYLNLSRNFLSTITANAFGSLEKLHELDLQHNMISDIQVLDGLLELRILNLNHNAISSTDFLYDGLSTLRRLSMTHNELTRIDGASFETLYSLNYLDLSSNRIASVSEFRFEQLSTLYLANNRLQDLRFIERLPQLKELDVGANRVTSLPGDSFRRLKFLRSIKLSHNRLNYIDSSAFDAEKLQRLDLSHNHLQEVLHFGWKRSLKHLYLHHNNISYFAPNALDGLTNLLTLDIASCRLGGLKRTTFSDLVSLTTLNVSHNPLATFLQTSKARALLEATSQLQTIDASFCELTSFPVSFSATSDHIRSIDLRGNRISQLDAASSLDSFKHLVTINLAENQFKVFDPGYLQQIESLKFANISHNPLVCSCDQKSFCDWLSSTNVNNGAAFDDDDDSYTCRHPDNRITSLSQYCDDISHQCHVTTNTRLWIVIAIVIIVTSLVSLVVAVLLFKYCRQRQKQKSKARKCRDIIAMQRHHATMNGNSCSKAETQKMMPDTCRYICEEFTYKSDVL